MNLRETIEEYSKKLDKAKKDEAWRVTVDACVEICEGLLAEISELDYCHGLQIAISAAFEVVAKATEDRFNGYDRSAKRVLIENLKIDKVENTKGAEKEQNDE